MSVAVTTQDGLDAAINAGAANVVIDSPAGVWLTIYSSGSSHVVARGSSHVVAWGSSRVVAWGSSHVEASGSSHVEARESSHVEASSHVAVHLHSHRVSLSGGVVIDMTAIDESDPTTWADIHGAAVTGDTITLFKALSDDLTSGRAHKPVTWPTTGMVMSPDWNPAAVCGGGLHLSPTIEHASYYHSGASRWLKCEARLADIVPILGDTAKCKAREVVVVTEVDCHGKPVAA